MTSILPRPVLADVIPGGLVRDATLVLGSTAFLGLIANVVIPLPFTPIPLSLSTFAVLLIGAALGPWRGGLATALYLAAGMAGMPWFAAQNSGWAFASFGYVIGYVLAALLVGSLARRGADRSMRHSVWVMLLGNLAVYAGGVPWLMAWSNLGLGEALMLGAAPFLVGDAIKVALAAGALPAAWKLVHDRNGR